MNRFLALPVYVVLEELGLFNLVSFVWFFFNFIVIGCVFIYSYLVIGLSG